VVYVESVRRDDEDKRMTAPSTSGESAVFRQAMREFAAGVSIVACGAREARSGCTVTALTSLSLAPPTLLVCLSRDAHTLKRLRETGAFSVNLLAARHRELADRFASRVGERGAARFAVGRWTTLATGSPLLADALAAIDCRVEEIIERHTHAIVIGAVVAVQRGEHGPALAHWRSHYETLE
jgi:flavin reductase (DIM6/NTAB) family NADH-FMN oxidoreductase RutF